LAKHPEPRRAQLDGADVVVLTPDEYERLDASRRQAGANASRIRSLSQKLAAATEFFDELEQALADLPACLPGQAGSCGEAPDCARRRVLAMVMARPGPVLTPGSPAVTSAPGPGASVHPRHCSADLLASAGPGGSAG
jgi:hypothetical protein